MQGRTWTDEWPSSQECADEVERVLAFLEAQGQLTPERFLGQLRGKLGQREGAIGHARAAYWLHRNGYRITHWEPKATNNPGDLEFQLRDAPRVFVEVKHRTWQSELTAEEIAGGRGKELPYKNGEVLHPDPEQAVLYAADKAIAMKKFASDRPNMLIVMVNLRTRVVEHLGTDFIAGQLDRPDYNSIGGILVLEVQSKNDKISYLTKFFENPRAMDKPWQIPIDVVVDLIARNHVST